MFFPHVKKLKLTLPKPSLKQIKIPKLKTKFDLGNMLIIPFLTILSTTVMVSMSLSNLDMQTLSYAVIAIFFLFCAITTYIYFRAKEISRYGLLHLIFFSYMLSVSFISDDSNLKEAFYISLYALSYLMICLHYRERFKTIVIFTAIAFAFCVYANLVYLFMHPELWFMEEEISGKGYLLGGNYNGMGCRMITALAFNGICYKYSKLWLINFIGLVIASIIPLAITGSMTSLAGIIIFLIIFITPSLRLKKLAAIALFVVIILFHLLVVFAGKGIENNELAVYFIEDVLGKDITLTGRTYLWDLALSSINESPIIGYGYVNMDWYNSHISIGIGNGPHNFILSVLINGGIILFFLYLIICFVALRKIWNRNNNTSLTILTSIASLMLMLMTEMQPYMFIIFLFALAYYSPLLETEQESTK